MSKIFKYIIVFFISMVPLVELRGAIPIAESIVTWYCWDMPTGDAQHILI